MPWLAVPFKDDQLRSVLSRKFNVSARACMFLCVCVWPVFCTCKIKPRTCVALRQAQRASVPPLYPTGGFVAGLSSSSSSRAHPVLSTSSCAALPSTFNLTHNVTRVGVCRASVQVQGIPQLVMLGPDSTILCSNARGALDNDPNGDNFPWEGAAQQSK